MTQESGTHLGIKEIQRIIKMYLKNLYSTKLEKSKGHVD